MVAPLLGVLSSVLCLAWFIRSGRSQQPCLGRPMCTPTNMRVSLWINPSARGDAWDGCSPCRQFDRKLLRDLEPEPPTWTASNSWTQKLSKIINICQYRLLSLVVISCGLTRSKEHTWNILKAIPKLWQQFVITSTAPDTIKLKQFCYTDGWKMASGCFDVCCFNFKCFLNTYHASSEMQGKRCPVGFKMIYYKMRHWGPPCFNT